MRHPGYAARILVCFPYAFLVTHSLVALALQVLLFAAGYYMRISAEETMLRSSLGDAYYSYEKRVPYRFVPFLL